MNNRQILEEASAWFVDFRTGEMDRAARRQFMDWLRRSPEHIRAYIDVSGTYAHLPTAQSIGDAAVRRMIEQTKARSFASATVQELPPPPIPLPREAGEGQRGGVPAHQHRRILLAASLAMLSIATGLIAWLAYARDPIYATRADEQRAIILDDGSRIDLNVRSKVRVKYTHAQRTIALIEGQALFIATRDPHRPFIVTSADTDVRAIGTKFDVYLKSSGTMVTVLEGRVAVSSSPSSARRGEGPGEVALLDAGDQAIVTPKSIARPSRPTVATVTGWTKGEVEFDETPLAEAIEEFNRYTHRPLRIDSPGLAQLRITGVYTSSDPASLIRFLRNQPGVVVTETNSAIRIDSR